jgi:hypothetical protein
MEVNTVDIATLDRYGRVIGGCTCGEDGHPGGEDGGVFPWGPCWTPGCDREAQVLMIVSPGVAVPACARCVARAAK